MNLQQLTEQGYATYTELKQAGIKTVIEKGKNEWGLTERTIIDNAGNSWEYIPEDNIYELVNK